MNPAAKEFVPAHLLKKRQEEAERVGELTQKLDKVDLKSDQDVQENAESRRDNSTSENSKEVQESSSKVRGDENSKPEQVNKNSTSSSNQQPDNHTPQEVRENGRHINNNNHNENDYPEGLQELIDEEDDRFLLNDGENLCEFNGEQFIIPGE